MLLFALFPAIFSFHQFIEGFVWLSRTGAFDGRIFRYIYIVIAVLLWPVLTPLASALAEPDTQRRRIRYGLFAVGLGLGAYLTFKLANASDIEARVVGHSLSYVIAYDSHPPGGIDYAYAAITLIPLLTMSNRALNAVGALVGAAFLYTFVEMKEVWFSVWCMSAALFSVLFYFSVNGQDRREI